MFEFPQIRCLSLEQVAHAFEADWIAWEVEVPEIRNSWVARQLVALLWNDIDVLQEKLEQIGLLFQGFIQNALCLHLHILDANLSDLCSFFVLLRLVKNLL